MAVYAACYAPFASCAEPEPFHTFLAMVQTQIVLLQCSCLIPTLPQSSFKRSAPRLASDPAGVQEHPHLATLHVQQILPFSTSAGGNATCHTRKSSTSCHCRETCGAQYCSMHAAGVTRSQEEGQDTRAAAAPHHRAGRQVFPELCPHNAHAAVTPCDLEQGHPGVRRMPVAWTAGCYSPKQVTA